ncbi:hypothetical protein PIB30_076294 [Stylosanthes scabra]|uniref:Uncharacterized protein n=1 Tax=Stylosanthes scabra TaxID=79078 RepID=A0ABU6XQS6_9FABA|nr:hypothetical protein [Stylosanthes scabra]
MSLSQFPTEDYLPFHALNTERHDAQNQRKRKIQRGEVEHSVAKRRCRQCEEREENEVHGSEGKLVCTHGSEPTQRLRGQPVQTRPGFPYCREAWGTACQVLRTRRNTLQRPHEFARDYFRRAGFEHVAYMLEWNHDWALASALVERWRPEDRVCQGVGEDATEERLMQYTHGYIMQMIGEMLFPDASDSRQMCRATQWGQRNLGGCMTLLLSWAYHRIPACRPDGFEQRHFPLAERWIGYEPPRDREETRLRGWRGVLNRLGIADVTTYSAMARPEYRYVARGVSAPLFSHSGVAPGGPCRQTIRIAAAHSVSAPEHRRDACSRRSLGPGGVVPGVPPGLVRDVARESSPSIAPRPSSRPTAVSILSGVVHPVGKSGPCGTGGRAGSACAARSPRSSRV